jgi:hypothetical protein
VSQFIEQEANVLWNKGLLLKGVSEMKSKQIITVKEVFMGGDVQLQIAWMSSLDQLENTQKVLFFWSRLRKMVLHFIELDDSVQWDKDICIKIASELKGNFTSAKWAADKLNSGDFLFSKEIRRIVNSEGITMRNRSGVDTNQNGKDKQLATEELWGEVVDKVRIFMIARERTVEGKHRSMLNWLAVIGKVESKQKVLPCHATVLAIDSSQQWCGGNDPNSTLFSCFESTQLLLQRSKCITIHRDQAGKSAKCEGFKLDNKHVKIQKLVRQIMDGKGLMLAKVTGGVGHLVVLNIHLSIFYSERKIEIESTVNSVKCWVKWRNHPKIITKSVLTVEGKMEIKLTTIFFWHRVKKQNQIRIDVMLATAFEDKFLIKGSVLSAMGMVLVMVEWLGIIVIPIEFDNAQLSTKAETTVMQESHEFYQFYNQKLEDKLFRRREY